MNRAGATQRRRPLPRQRKIFGTSYDADGEVMVYTETQVAEFGDACYRDGYRDAMVTIRKALDAASVPIESGSYSTAQRAEDDAWAEYNAGRGPHPTRR